MSIQKKAYKQSVKQKEMDWLNNSIECTKCGTRKHKDEYYVNRTICKECCLIQDKAKRDQEKEDRFERNGGSLRVPAEPGEYVDDLQKKYTAAILEACGWTYDEDTRIWFKLPLKDNNGQFYHPITKQPFKKDITDRIRHFRLTVDETTIPKLIVQNRRYKTAPDEIINKMLHEYFINKDMKKDLVERYEGQLNPHQIDKYIKQCLYMGIDEPLPKD